MRTWPMVPSIAVLLFIFTGPLYIFTVLEILYYLYILLSV